MDINQQKNLEDKNVETEELKSDSQVAETNAAGETKVEELSGIGGWLILIGIGRVLSPIVLLLTIFRTYLPKLKSGTLDVLSQPGKVGYSTLWKPTILFELYANIIFLVFGIVLLFLFFGKKRLFPKVYISLIILTIVFSIVDAVLIYRIQSQLTVNLSMNPISQIVKPVLNGAIWIPYFLTSIRVKNTFVR